MSYFKLVGIFMMVHCVLAETDIQATVPQPRVIVHVFESGQALPDWILPGDAIWLELEYAVSPDGPTLHTEAGERLWWIQDTPILLLGATGLPLPGCVLNRATAYMRVFLEGEEIPGSPVRLNPQLDAIAIDKDKTSIEQALSHRLAGVEGSYLSQVANYLAGNLASLDVHGTSYSVNGFGTVIDSSGSYSGTDGAFDGTLTVDGTLGIGTTNPQTGALHIKAPTVGISGGLRMETSLGTDEDWYVYMNDDDDLVIRNDVTDLVTIEKDTGHVGIRTSDLSDSLVVDGKVFISERDSNGVGWIRTLGPNGELNVQISNNGWAPDHGFISIRDADAYPQVKIFVHENGDGYIEADVKNFRVPYPGKPDLDIVYACVEGPEAAMYVRGTGQLSDGRARIELPDHFRVLALESSMTVQLTPRSFDSKGLAVGRTALDGIEVGELFDGKGNYAFDWEVKAVRRAHRDYRVLRSWDEDRPADDLTQEERWQKRQIDIQRRQERLRDIETR